MARSDPVSNDGEIRLALRATEAARALGISPRKLFTLSKAGEVPHVRVDGVVLYPLHALRHWLDARQQGGLVNEPDERSV